MPIGFLEDRKKMADAVNAAYPIEDYHVYIYSEATEKILREKYGKYVRSTSDAHSFEEVKTPTEQRVPRRISGCCDRADQY